MPRSSKYSNQSEYVPGAIPLPPIVSATSCGAAAGLRLLVAGVTKPVGTSKSLSFRKKRYCVVEAG